jgi:pilus assembly protein CpaC
MKALLRSTLVALSLFSVPTFAEPPQKSPPELKEELITVRAGNSKKLELVGVVRIALGDPAIADVSTLGGNIIQVDGKKAGETKLIIWVGSARRVYRVVVEK